MIWIANDVGSKELERYFAPFDVPVQKTELEFADFVFYGNGPDGACSIGVERKTIGFYATDEGEGRYGTDLIQSKRSGRMGGHQVPGLFLGYDYVFFLIEGLWFPGENGEVVVPHGKDRITLRHGGGKPILYRELSNYLMTLQLKCGGFVQRTGSSSESVAWLVGLYKWFQKEWTEHEGDRDIYTPECPAPRDRRRGWVPVQAGPVETFAHLMPGVATKAWEFGGRFKSVRELANADEKTLQEVDGVGKKGAARIVRWLRGTD